MWLLTPGITAQFHIRTLGLKEFQIDQQRAAAMRDPHIAELVKQNWASATREDAVRLAQVRPRHVKFPLLCIMQMIADKKAGMTYEQLGRDYGVMPDNASIMVHRGPRGNYGPIPDWLQPLLPPRAYVPVAPDAINVGWGSSERRAERPSGSDWLI